ncbi:protein-L-isoaspartate O-methyltransferase [bacterium BMS3Abin07]|nr:protein-L-isoaspartate O-methyltransferase [bacterium BMS3Abin07]GBE33302.1 protein-L-isoaspartate O-methyltransferase [bacterium BMS3Bbin05]HDO21648.1 protein-L-isoaspartate(D-aspartate) O-methyltransferase [Nitrospirota bacterium]HDZ87149.1 protein-L-isoaspartate(D-aspartate) O-methyltransferase [Nitrospirota bacterium]
MDFGQMREYMVRTQLLARHIKDARVIEAMKKVPRHLFVPEIERIRAYDDCALPIGHGQTISQPYMVAIMTELLDLAGKEKVLEIGTGSGYQTAVLAELSDWVFSVERIAELTDYARENLRKAGCLNVTLKTSDGSEGWIEEAPFDRIIVTAATPEFPVPLIEQLAENGIGIAPVGSRYNQILTKITKKEGQVSRSSYTMCVFVPLVGKHGWEESNS